MSAAKTGMDPTEAERQDHGRLDWPARERLMVYRRSSRGNGSCPMHD